MNIICRTNLDLHPAEKWPTSLPVRPVVGDVIESATEWPNGRLQLKVVGITWTYSKNQEDWVFIVELNLYLNESIQDFQKRYRRMRSS